MSARMHAFFVHIGAEIAFWFIVFGVVFPMPVWGVVTAIVIALAVAFYTWRSYQERKSGLCPDCGHPFIAAPQTAL